MLWGRRRGRGTIVATEPRECPMPQANDSSRCLLTLEQDSTLIVVVELSQASWLVAGIVPAVERQPLKKIEADEAALLRLLGRWRDEATRAGRGITRVCVAFEAGRDGLLAGPLAAGARRRGPRHPPVERRGLAGAPAGQDRPARHRAAQARLPRLAARRTGPLHHGRDPDGRGGGRQAAEPGAREPGRRAHPDREPDEERPAPPRRPGLQADAAQGLRAARDAAHAGGGAAAAEHARRAAPRHGPPAARARPDRGGRGGAPGTAGEGARVAPARDG